MDTIDTIKQPPRRKEVWTIWFRRLGWLGFIWVLSVCALGAVAGAMRWMMHSLGMHER